MRDSKDYGNFAPFFVKAGSSFHLVLRDPAHFEKVLSQFEATTSQIEAYDKIFGMPESAFTLYSGKGATGGEKAAVHYAHDELRQKYLTGASLTGFTETYVTILHQNLDDKMFQLGTWTQIEDTWSFLEQVITRCAFETLFGSDLFKQYPSIVRDFWKYAEAIEDYIPGVPRFMVPSAATQACDRLLRGIEKWLNANHSGSDFARFEKGDSDLDAFKGSKFVQERDDVLANILVIDLRARAAEMLRLMHEYVQYLSRCQPNINSIQ
jgi:hypothetical protein